MSTNNSGTKNFPNLSENTVKKVKRINSICLSALIGITGILYAVFCAHLYLTGGSTPYSAERVGSYLAWLIPISIITVIDAIFGGVLAVTYPEKEKDTVGMLPSYALMKNVRWYATAKIEPSVNFSLAKEKNKRIIMCVITAAVVSICTAISLIIALNGSQYKLEDLNGEIIGVVVLVLPLMAVAIASVAVCYHLYEMSCGVSRGIYSEAVANGTIKKSRGTKNAENTPEDSKSGENATDAEKSDDNIPDGGFFYKAASNVKEKLVPTFNLVDKHEGRIILGAQISIGVVAVVFIVLGVIGGGMSDVLAKAVKICTECIGLG